MDELAREERRHWARALGLEPDAILGEDPRLALMEKCAAITTLNQGPLAPSNIGRDRPADRIAELAAGDDGLPGLTDASRARAFADVTGAVEYLYASEDLGNLSPVRPDLLGEHIVTDGVGRGDGLLERFFDSSIADSVSGLLVIDRCLAPRHGLARRSRVALSLSHALPPRMENLAGAVASAALAGAEQLVGTEAFPGLIDSIIDLLDEKGFRSLRDAGPVHSERLLYTRRLAAERLKAALDLKSEPSIPLPNGYSALDLTELAQRAFIASSNSRSFGLAGQAAEAAHSAETAVDLFRRAIEGVVPEAQSGDILDFLTRCQKGLIWSLNLQGNWLADLEMLDRALDVQLSSLALARKVLDPNSDQDQFEVSSCLHNLANRYYVLDRFSEAMSASLEAVEIRRRLMIADPEKYTFDYVNSAKNLSRILERLDRARDAFMLSDEVMRHVIVAYDVLPDQFEEMLASCFLQHSTLATAVGKGELALASALEATRIYQAQFEKNPKARASGFANALLTLAVRFAGRGDLHRAVETADLGVNIAEAVLAGDPMNALEPKLRAKLHAAAARPRWSMGRRSEAIERMSTAVRLLEAAPKYGNEDTSLLRRFSENLAEWYDIVGDTEEASRVRGSLGTSSEYAPLREANELITRWIALWNAFVKSRVGEDFKAAEYARMEIEAILSRQPLDVRVDPARRSLQRYMELIKPDWIPPWLSNSEGEST